MDEDINQKSKLFHKWFIKGLQFLESEKYICANIYKDEEEYSCELVGTDKLVKDEDNWNFDEKMVYERQNPFIICKSDISEKAALKCFFNLIKNEYNNKETLPFLKGKTFTYGLIDGKLYFAKTTDLENEI